MEVMTIRETCMASDVPQPTGISGLRFFDGELLIFVAALLVLTAPEEPDQRLEEAETGINNQPQKEKMTHNSESQRVTTQLTLFDVQEVQVQSRGLHAIRS